MQLTTRLAVPADFATVARITSGAFRAGPYGHIQSSPEREQFVLDVAARAAMGVVIVALVGGRIVGATSLLRAETEYARLAVEGESEIRLLAVDPDAQGAGVGEALVRASLAQSLLWGASRVVLDTGSLNLSAQRLYERLGFVRTDAATADTANVTSLTYAFDLASAILD